MQTLECLACADAMIALNRRDIACAAPRLPAGAAMVEMRPFVDPAQWLDPALGTRLGDGPRRIVAVAMMREGDKERSWSKLADWLSRVHGTNWCLDVVGDGAARGRVEARLGEVLGRRVHFHGRLESGPLRRVLDAAHLFVWPAVNEAFGMALLEAQARGLAVVAARHGGVSGVVCHGISGWLTAPGDEDAAAAAVIDYLVERPAVVERMGRQGRRRVRAYHNLEHAAHTIDRLVKSLCAKSS